jgi:hypothetical protein
MTANTALYALGPSEGDAMHRVFRVGDSIYRAIPDSDVAFTRHLFDSGVVDALVAANLLTPSRLVEDAVPDYPLAVEQPELLANSLPVEMPPSMRRDAGIVLLQLARVLAGHGLALRDVGYSGLMVDRKGRLVFHDIAAIQLQAGHKFPYAEFHANFLGPLRLIDRRPELVDLVQRAGAVAIDEDISIRRPVLRAALRLAERLGGPGRKLNELYRRAVVRSPFGGLLHCGLYATFIRAAIQERRYRAGDGGDTQPGWTDALSRNLEKRLERLDFSAVAQRWTDYYGHIDLVAIARAESDWAQNFTGERERALIDVLSGMPPGTLLDIGANNGYFSMLGAHCGFATTAVDYDIGAIDGLYRLLKSTGSALPIRPFVMNFARFDEKHWSRFTSDAVFALGFVHHMRLVELLPWPVIAAQLSSLTRKVLVTEFKPGTFARHAKHDMTGDVTDDHTLAHFVEALEAHFPSVEVIGDFTAMHSVSARTMIVCRR